MSRKKDPVQVAVEAHTNLNIFGAIIAILEGGSIYGGTAQAAADAIIQRCQREQQRQLAEYDRALAALKGGEDAHPDDKAGT